MFLCRPFTFRKGYRMNDEELATIKSMLDIPRTINLCKFKLENVSKDFFSSYSLIGGMIKDPFEQYTRGIDPFHAALVITMNESVLKKRIERYMRRYGLFEEEFTKSELEELRTSVKSKKSTNLTKRAYEWIQEVDYYLTARYDDEIYLSMTGEERIQQLRELQELDNEFEEMMRGVEI